MSALARSPALKLLLIGFIMLLLQLPIVSVRELIDERHQRANETETELTAQWGGAQTLAAAYIRSEYSIPNPNRNATRERVNRQRFLFPDHIKIDAQLNPEMRHRGLFEVPVYTADIDITARFAAGEVTDFMAQALEVEKPELRFALSDQVGVRKIDGFTAGETKLRPDTAGREFYDLTAFSLPLAETTKNLSGDLTVHYRLTLAGARALEFLPLARTTEVSMRGDWGHPSFDGRFLPTQHTIEEKQFSAQWQVLEFNREIPHRLELTRDETSYERLDTINQLLESVFRVNLYEPASLYQQNDRAAKYAVLIMALVFIALFLFETVGRRVLHGVHYGFTGLALALFYLLLLAISEHAGFVLAYLIAAIAITVLIAGYARAVLGSLRAALTLAALQAVAYGQFFLLIRSADAALLLGATTLFVALAAAMYLTRHTQWGRGGEAIAIPG